MPAITCRLVIPNLLSLRGLPVGSPWFILDAEAIKDNRPRTVNRTLDRAFFSSLANLDLIPLG